VAKKQKLKTHRGAAKRFKVTSTGKIMRPHSGKRHLMGTKKPKRMRHLRESTLLSSADAPKVRRMLPYS
jgi:large subunit ribosomal protein L35